ncbi:MAG: single-stranded-DNA-specific exonuclease RecJ [Kiritimatiellae bacterium]|nr:single-stranded-DNA-specific exonuclease RecJ [Kiritimatiellia bacterium]
MKRWITAPIDLEAVDRLVQESGLPLSFSKLCVARNLRTLEDVQAYCDVRLRNLSNPFDLSGVEEAAQRLLRALNNKERVTVFGDYDVDGITSTALLIHLFSELGILATPFIPDRMEEGYGVTTEAMQRCLECTNPSLIVTVDCGISSISQIELAKQAGVDVIVTDHHEPGATLPDAEAVINPKLQGASPYHELAGVGVAFKVAHGLLKLGRATGLSGFEEVDLRRYLDLTAVGTICDLVPLIAENRILARQGIARLRKTENTGLKALAACASIHLDEADSYHIGFQLGPRLNASGRLSSAETSLQLLLSDDTEAAAENAAILDEHNTERRRLEASILAEACSQIDARLDPVHDFFLVVSSNTWHPGVIGIVASRLAKKYRRPTAVIAVDEKGEGRGSCRSIEDFNIVEALNQCESFMGHHGGHPMAAGFSIHKDRIASFSEAINELARRHLEGRDLRESVRIDCELGLGDLDRELYRRIETLAPFGMGNPKPVISVGGPGVQVISKRLVGQKHTRLSVTDGRNRTSGIYFNCLPEDIPEGDVCVALTLQLNHFNGNTNLEMQVLDIAPYV